MFTLNSKKNPTESSNRIYTEMPKTLHKQFVKNPIQNRYKNTYIKFKQRQYRDQKASKITLHRSHNSH